MIKARLALLTGMVALGAIAGSASAKPLAAVCNLVVDDKGDANGTFLADETPLPSEDAVDIVSADLATNAKTITAVIRVAKLSTTVATSPQGLHAKFIFTAPGSEFPLFLQGSTDSVDGATFSAGYIDQISNTLGAANGVFDTANNEIRISAPLSIFSAQAKIKNGSKLSTFELSSGRYVNGVAFSFSDSTDTAVGAKSYTAGAASCVKIGK